MVQAITIWLSFCILPMCWVSIFSIPMFSKFKSSERSQAINYKCNNGLWLNLPPDKWPKLFPAMCAGYAQSPIDIVPSEAVELPKGTGFTIKLSSGPNFDPRTKYKVSNNGHTGMLTCLRYEYFSSNFIKAWPMVSYTQPAFTKGLRSCTGAFSLGIWAYCERT